ncbi:NAD(P)/FAD-dependent oxidoreductase, partial [Kordia sp. YSTF-M3]
MKTTYQILIIGGGTAGLMTASSLLEKNPKLDIGIIEPSDKHWYQPAWTLVGAGTYNYNKTQRPMKSVMPKNADWIKDKAVSFDPDTNTVATAKNGVISYEYLIVAPGLKLDPSKVEGLTDAI